MIYANTNISDVSFCSMKTGKEIMSLDFSDFSQETMSAEDKPKFYMGGTATIEFDNSYINQEALNALC